MKIRNPTRVLLAACNTSCVLLAKTLLSSNLRIEINAEDKILNNAALHYVIWHSQNDFNELHSACKKGEEDKVIQLLIKDAKINAQDN